MSENAFHRAGAALRYPQFRLFWSGAVVSNIGTWMQNITVPYVLFRLTDSGAWVGLAVVAQILPSILLNPLAGSLADRFSRRNLLRVANTIQGLAAFGLAAMWSGGVRSPVAILLLVAVGGTAGMVSQPAWQAFVTDLVPAEHLLNAVTLNSAQANAARAIGPAVGGVLLGTLGPTSTFLVNGCSYLAVILTLTWLHPPVRRGAPPQGRVLTQYREAARHARAHRGIVTAYALTAVVCGLGHPVFQLAAVFASRVYDAGPGRYGLLTAAYGGGAIVGAVLLSAFGVRRARGQLMPVLLAIQATSIVAFGLSRTFWVGVPLLAVVGGASLCSIATLNTAVQTSSPEQLRGRLLALWILSYTASYPLGSVVQGSFADWIGPNATVTTAGVLMGGVAVVLLARPALAHALDGQREVVLVDPIPATS